MILDLMRLFRRMVREVLISTFFKSSEQSKQLFLRRMGSILRVQRFFFCVLQFCTMRSFMGFRVISFRLRLENMFDSISSIIMRRMCSQRGRNFLFFFIIKSSESFFVYFCQGSFISVRVYSVYSFMFSFFRRNLVSIISIFDVFLWVMLISCLMIRFLVSLG